LKNVEGGRCQISQGSQGIQAVRDQRKQNQEKVVSQNPSIQGNPKTSKKS